MTFNITAKELCDITNKVILRPRDDPLHIVILESILNSAHQRAKDGHYFLKYTTEEYYSNYCLNSIDDTHGKLLFALNTNGFHVVYKQNVNNSITYTLSWGSIY